jgi:hypothetical protein
VLTVAAASFELGAVEEGIGAAQALVTRTAIAMRRVAAFAVGPVRSKG